MNLLRYIYVFYAVFVWIVVLLMFWRNPKRAKELFPIAILGLIILFISEEYLINAGLYQFPNAHFPVYGVPLFHLIWGAGSAIILMYFLPKNFMKKLIVILVFTGITLLFEFIPEHVGKAEHLGRYNEILDAIQDCISLILLVFLAEGIFGKRIHPNNRPSMG